MDLFLNLQQYFYLHIFSVKLIQTSLCNSYKYLYVVNKEKTIDLINIAVHETLEVILIVNGTAVYTKF